MGGTVIELNSKLLMRRSNKKCEEHVLGENTVNYLLNDMCFLVEFLLADLSTSYKNSSPKGPTKKEPDTMMTVDTFGTIF